MANRLNLNKEMFFLALALGSNTDHSFIEKSDLAMKMETVRSSKTLVHTASQNRRTSSSSPP
jgi:hypothetical protein